LAATIDHADLVAEAGGDYIEESVQGFLLPDKSAKAFEAKVSEARSAPVRIEALRNFLPGRLKSVGPEADHDAILAWAHNAFQRAQKIGVNVIVFGSGGSRRIPNGFNRDKAALQFVELLQKLAPLAEQSNINLCLEPLRPQEVNFINRVSEAAIIVDRVGHPNIQLTADLFHMLHADEQAQSIVAAGRKIHHVHIAEKNGRRTPGVHGEDFRQYFHALQSAGYVGPVTIEGKWRPEELSNGFITIREQWDLARQTDSY
jgi:sugar phosphate isomerase/epimerase